MQRLRGTRGYEDLEEAAVKGDSCEGRGYEDLAEAPAAPTAGSLCQDI